MKLKSLPYLWTALLLGALPALVILIFVSFNDQEMRMLGLSLPGYGLASLFALSLSPIRPLLLLLGPALAFAVDAEAALKRWLTFVLIPACLILPLCLAATIKGSSISSDVLIASFYLCLSMTTFAAWFRLFSRLKGRFATALILYGVCWSISGLLHYIALYVVPYQESSWLQSLSYLRFGLPQTGYAFELLDEGLAGAGWPLKSWAPLFVQLPVLLILDLVLGRPQKK